MKHPEFEQIKNRALLQRSEGDSIREIGRVLEYQRIEPEVISEIISEVKAHEEMGYIEKPSIKASAAEMIKNKIAGSVIVVVGVIMIVGLWNAGWVVTLPAGIIGLGIKQFFNRRAAG